MGTSREIGDAYEKLVITELGGRVIPGSGSIREKKEDGDFPGLRMQVKYRGGKSISITADELESLQQHALDCGKIPAYLFGISGGKQEWVAFPLWLMKSNSWFRLMTGFSDDVQSEG